MSSSITTIDGHVLLPHQADWMTPPDMTRMWRSAAEQSMGGTEDRVSVRSTAWVRLSYDVLPFDHVERARFETRFREGIKAGKVAVPFWGKGVPLSEDATVASRQLNLTRTDHGIAAGKRVLVQSRQPAQYDEFDLCLVQSVSGARLNIASGLAYGYPEGTRVWQLLYGRPIPQNYEVRNSTRSRFKVAVQFDGRQVSAQAFDDFGDYAVGVVSDPLSGGDGWIGPWVLGMAA